MITDNPTPYENPTDNQYALYALEDFMRKHLKPYTQAYRDMNRILSELQKRHEAEWIERLKNEQTT